MVGELKSGDDSSRQWSETSGRVGDIDNGVRLMSDSLMVTEGVEASHPQPSAVARDAKVGFPETVLAAAGSAFLSAILVNPLDVVKTRLQAQAAGAAYSHPLSDVTSRMAIFGPNMMFADLRCSPACSRAGVHGTVSLCPPDCFQYKGSWDVFYKIIRQEGIARLWRGTNAGLALAVPTVGIYLPLYDVFLNRFEEFTSQNCTSLAPYAPLVAGGLARSLACTSCYPIELARTRMQAYKAVGKKSPGVFRTLIEVVSSGQTMPPNQSEAASCAKTAALNQSLKNSRILFTGLGAQLARDVPYSAICWATLEPVRRRLLGLIGENENVAGVLAANFSAGFVAGSFAAAATCPFDVAKTRRQIEKDPLRALRMTTRQTLLEIWRDGGMKGLFTGVGPRVARAGPSVGIVVSFYEVVKYALHRHYNTT